MTGGLPSLTLNRLFVQDLMAAPAPCFALGYVDVDGQLTGCLALRPATPIPDTSTGQGFRFGHRALGTPAAPVFQFSFQFYGHQIYHGLVIPSNPLVQAVIRRMLETQDYFFFAINPDQTLTAFRSRLDTADLAGLRTNQEQFGAAACSGDDYDRLVTAFRQRPDPPGQVMAWVCRHNPAYLDLTTHRLDLNPAPEQAPTDTPPEIIWQPLAMLPAVVRMAEEALADAEAQLANIRAGVGRPGVLDAPMVERAKRVYGEQRDFLAIYAQQAARWGAEGLTRQQQTLLEQLVATTTEATAINAELLELLAAWTPPVAPVPAPARPSGASDPEKPLKAAGSALAMGSPKKARALMDTALTTPDLAPHWQAHYLTMRGTINRELGNERAGIADYQAALVLMDGLPEPDPLHLIDLLGMLANALTYEDADAAYALYLREDALVTAHKDLLLRHPDKRVTWVMAPLGLAMVEELRERWPEARRWYQEAQSRCTDARVKPRQRLAQMIVEGLERLPPGDP